MSSEWSTGKLGEFVELKRGYDLPQAKRKPGGIPLVSSSGVSDRHNVAMVKGPGVVTGRYGTIGQVFYVEDDFWPLNTTLYVRDFKGNDRKFIHYFLKTLDFHAYSDKAAVPGVNRNHLHEAVVSIPPVYVQREIAAFLGALDDRIKLLRETNTTLEAIVQALFKSWFVDFDPVHNKAKGLAPEGMDEVAAALFPDSFEKSDLGAVPKGWLVGDFGNVLTEYNMRVGNSHATVLSAVQTGELVRSDEHFTKRVHSENIEKYKAVPPYSFAYNPSRINIGSIGLNESNHLGAVSPVYTVATAKNRGHAYLVWHHLRTQRVRDSIATLATGTVRQSLSFSDFASIPLITPPIQLIECFLNYRDAIYHRVATNNSNREVLVEILETLLPRLISGKLGTLSHDSHSQEAL